MFSLKPYKDNLKHTLLTLGIILLVGVVLGLAAEVWLCSAETMFDMDQVGPASLGATLSLALASMRMALPVVGVLAAIPLLALRLLHILYATKDLNEAHNALNRIIFGQLGGSPRILVKEGKIASGEDTFAHRVGGPVSLTVHSDSAVVTEQYGRLKQILGPGRWQLKPFEKIWAIIDFRPQCWIYEVSALTKEGIPISCEADISFKIDDHHRDPRWKVHVSETYPYAEEAVFRAATSTWIRKTEREDPRIAWTGRVVVDSTDSLLRDILAEYRLDWLLAPTRPGDEHPREKIRKRLEDGLRERVIEVGARLLNVEIGMIEVKARDEQTSNQLSEVVSKQWIEGWEADWKRRALASKAEGEAELLRIDMARIQAQANMVVTLIDALQSTIVSQRTIEPYILALRFVEVLRWTSYNTKTHEFMPPEAMRTLKQLQQLLEPEAHAPDNTKKSEESQEGV
jgi:hypothetical protein